MINTVGTVPVDVCRAGPGTNVIVSLICLIVVNKKEIKLLFFVYIWWLIKSICYNFYLYQLIIVNGTIITHLIINKNKIGIAENDFVFEIEIENQYGFFKFVERILYIWLLFTRAQAVSTTVQLERPTSSCSCYNHRGALWEPSFECSANCEVIIIFIKHIVLLYREICKKKNIHFEYKYFSMSVIYFPLRPWKQICSICWKCVSATRFKSSCGGPCVDGPGLPG